MYFNDIIFQVKINDEYFLGYFKLNILNYAIFDYQNREDIDDDESKNKITKENYIEEWLNRTYSKLYVRSFNSKVIIIEIYENTELIDKLNFDIIMNQYTKKIKLKDFEFNIEDYEDIYKSVHNNNNIINLEKDYNDDELEYVVDLNFVYKKVEEDYKKYYDEEYDIREEYKEEIDLMEKNNKGLCLEEILQNKYKKELEDKYKHMKEEEFKKSKIEDVEKRLKILKFLMKNYKKINSSFYDFCINKYLTQKMRRYKYLDDNLEKIRYNFVVTSYDTESERDYEEMNIKFKSLNYNVEGKGSCIQRDDRYGRRTTFNCNIEDKDNKFDFDEYEDLFKEIIDNITDELRYYS
jgi:hypothetical protein